MTKNAKHFLQAVNVTAPTCSPKQTCSHVVAICITTNGCDGRSPGLNVVFTQGGCLQTEQYHHHRGSSLPAALKKSYLATSHALFPEA